jgi:diguanylate cyclase (GGDEF)-like protein/PAS domain S-box-containing protein
MALKTQNLRIGRRIALALLLPLLGLLVAAFWIVAGYNQAARNSENLHSMAMLAPVIGQLVHAIQIERGLSAGFIGSEQATFAENLPLQYQVTDRRIAEFERVGTAFDTAYFGVETGQRLANRITQARQAVARISVWRKMLGERKTSPTELADRYHDTVNALIGIAEEMLQVSSNGDLTRAIYAYMHIIQAKESAGLERATGVAGIAAGHFDAATYARLMRLIDRQQFYFEGFRTLATARQIELLDHLLASPVAVEINRMRREVMQHHAAASQSMIDAPQWFGTMTRKIDLLKMLEEQIADDLISYSLQVKNVASHTTRWVSLLTLGILAIAAMFAFVIARGIVKPLQRITRSMSQLAARDGAITIEDHERGDEIGDIARALIVFRENLLQVAQTEERLKSEAILRVHHAALESISQGVLITDAQRHIIYANPAFQRISGYSEAEILGISPAFLHNKGGDAGILDEMLTALAAGRHFHGNLLNYRKDGIPFWSDLSISPVCDDTGAITHFVGITRDITESRLLQQELRIAATAFESLHGIMVTDANGIIQRVNNAFTEMTGYTAAEVIGKTPAILKSGRHDPEFYAEMWHQLAATGAWYGEVWDRRKNGEVFPKLQTISAVKGLDARTTHYVAAFSDISERKAAEDEIRHLAFYDPLTLLPNRRLLLDRLQHAIAASERTRRYVGLMFIDLDNFKSLNDNFGHDKGDLLLQQVARRLSECVREGDTVARIGGDEFVLMLEDLSSEEAEASEQIRVIGDKLLATLNRPYPLEQLEYPNTPSIGITLFRGHSAGLDELLKQADIAMYRAKAQGRNRLCFFTPDGQ